KKLKRFSMVKSYAAMVIKFAIKRGLIDRNPYDFVEIPIIKKRILFEEDEEDNYHIREQLIELINYIEKEGNLHRYTFFNFLTFSGMRKSEGFGLMWRDIDFVSNEIRINKAVARSEEGLYLGPTKNGLSRNIKMDNKTMDLLKEWKMEQAEEYLELGFNTLG